MGLADKFKEYFSLEKRLERSKNNQLNIKARKRYEKVLSELGEGAVLTDEQKLILYSQALEYHRLKNPADAIFPPFEEFTVTPKEGYFRVEGYVDATNSYGAKTRDNYGFDIGVVDGELTAVLEMTATGTIAAIVVALIIVAGILSYCSIFTSI